MYGSMNPSQILLELSQSSTIMQPSTRTVTILLALILAAAFLLRAIGIDYGLPLFIVADEPPSISGALKMMELKTLIPAFHEEVFKTTLYFPPYMAYLYLVPFAAVLLTSLVFFDGSFWEFQQFIISDPSVLFIAARLIAALLGVATVYLVYKTAERLFVSKTAALLSAAFLALSLLHINFSHWARHWVPVTFLFALVLYILSRDDIKRSKRYILASLVTGIGFGVNYQMVLAVPFILLWLFLYERVPIRSVLSEAWGYAASALFLLLAGCAIALYPAPLFIHSTTTLALSHSLGGLMSGYSLYAEALFRNEPFLLLSMLLGGIALILGKPRLAGIVIGFSFFYIAFFYFFFLLEGRYIVMLYPLFALASGYGWSELWRRFSGSKAVAALCIGGLCLMAVTALRFDQLLLRNDMRIQAIAEIEKTVPEGTKVITLARLTRLSSLPEAIAEQEALDPASLRSVDDAERALDATFFTKSRYHALNLSTLKSEGFLEHLGAYAKEHSYEYLLYSPEFAKQRGIGESIELLGTEQKRFEGFEGEKDDITNGFGKGFIELFRMSGNGPTMVLKKLSGS